MPTLDDGVTSYPPSGIDWADGVDYPAGTPTPAGSLVVDTALGATAVADIDLEEHTDSPTIERAEQGTITHRFVLPYDEAINQLSFLSRGTVLTDSFENETKVLSATVQRSKTNMAILTIISESLSFDTPPDDFSITPVELGVNLLKHPRYFYALQGANSTEQALNQEVIRWLQTYMENPSVSTRNDVERRFVNSIGHLGSLTAGGGINSADSTLQPFTDPNGSGATIQPFAGTDLAKRAGIEILQKFWRGEETPYVVGYQVVWTAFYRSPQYLNPGGYIEDPVGFYTSPQLPAYFWNPNWPIEMGYEHTILDYLGKFNPQCYTDTGLDDGNVALSWLRKSDQMTYQRTWYRVERTWIGSAVGYWDPDIYAATHRPQVPGDYNAPVSSPPLIPAFHGSGGSW